MNPSGYNLGEPFTFHGPPSKTTKRLGPGHAVPIHPLHGCYVAMLQHEQVLVIIYAPLLKPTSL